MILSKTYLFFRFQNMKGWYDYDKNIGKGRKPLPSKEVDALISRYVHGQSIPFSEREIVERVLFPLVNEGFKCLEEGIANQPSDIDVVYLYGYGWPIYRGGKYDLLCCMTLVLRHQIADFFFKLIFCRGRTYVLG